MQQISKGSSASPLARQRQRTACVLLSVHCECMNRYRKPCTVTRTNMWQVDRENYASGRGSSQTRGGELKGSLSYTGGAHHTQGELIIHILTRQRMNCFCLFPLGNFSFPLRISTYSSASLTQISSDTVPTLDTDVTRVLRHVGLGKHTFPTEREIRIFTFPTEKKNYQRKKHFIRCRSPCL